MIYTCKDFSGFYPVGSAAVVSASSAQEAADKLNEALRKIGLEGDAVAVSMLPFTKQDGVRILVDGNY